MESNKIRKYGFILGAINSILTLIVYKTIGLEDATFPWIYALLIMAGVGAVFGLIILIVTKLFLRK